MQKDIIFGVSPEGLVSPDLLIEIKTRAASSAGPLEDLRKNSYCFIQTQVQMVYNATKYCIIKSFHPESTSANYFLVTQHNFLWDVIVVVVSSMYNKTHIQEWSHRENVTLQIVEKNILRRVPEFESLKPDFELICSSLFISWHITFSLNQICTGMYSSKCW